MLDHSETTFKEKFLSNFKTPFIIFYWKRQNVIHDTHGIVIVYNTCSGCVCISRTYNLILKNDTKYHPFLNTVWSMFNFVPQVFGRLNFVETLLRVSFLDFKCFGNDYFHYEVVRNNKWIPYFVVYFSAKLKRIGR